VLPRESPDLKKLEKVALLSLLALLASHGCKEGPPPSYVRVAGPAPALTSLFVLAAVKDTGLPTNDVRVQGSALRKPTAMPKTNPSRSVRRDS
jgi:hypothetical protein